MYNQLRILTACFFAAVSLLVAGCQSDRVCDARGPSEICEIHHTFMETEVLLNKKKTTELPPQAYLAARSQFFFHSYPFVLPEKCTRCAVYICADCVRAEQEWKRKNR